MTAPSQLGSYRILGELRRGPIGVFYHGRDELRERDVTVKILLPNIVTLFDLRSDTDGSPYLVMEPLKGRTLDQTLRQSSPLALQRKVAIIIQVLAGLDHAHQSGIVHRDINPGTIFIPGDGPVKIIDFGVA